MVTQRTAVLHRPTADFYNYTGNAITVTNTVKFFGETIDGANYNTSITLKDVVSTVVNKGEYKLTVSGVNDNKSRLKDFLKTSD